MDNTSDSLFEVILKYSEERDKMRQIRDNELDKQYLQRTRKIQDFQDKHRADLLELRNCVEYINRHAQMIQGALRGSDGSMDSHGVVPMCHSTVGEIISLRDSIQQSLTNANQIKQIVGVTHQPFLDCLIDKMEKALINWTELLKVATRNFINSKALMENIQNLVVGQQQICAEVTSSDLFQSLNEDDQNDLQDNDHKCSTPSPDQII